MKSDKDFDYIDYGATIRKVITNCSIFNDIRFKLKDNNSNIYILEENPPNIVSIRNAEARRYKLSNMSFTTILGKEEDYIKNEKFKNKVNSCNASVLTNRNRGEILKRAKKSFDVIIIWKSDSFFTIESRFSLLKSPGVAIFPIILKQGAEGDNKMRLGQLSEEEIDNLFEDFKGVVGEAAEKKKVDINDRYYSLVFCVGGR